MKPGDAALAAGYLLLAAGAAASIPWYGLWPAAMLSAVTFLGLMALVHLAGPH